MNRVIRACFLAVAMLSAFAAAAGGAEKLSLPTSRAYMPPPPETNFAAPRFSGGVLINWRYDTYEKDSRDNLFVRDRQGNLVASYRLFTPGASLVRIGDAAASDDGSVAVVGFALSNEGRYSGYLAIQSLDSSNARIVQLAPYEARRITYGPDGTLWVLGGQRAKERQLPSEQSFSILHHYTSDGALIGRHLPWPEMVECGERSPMSGSPYLAVSADRIGVLLPVCGTWLEVSLQGELLGSYKSQIEGFDNAEANIRYQRPVITPAGGEYCHILATVPIDGEKTFVEELYTFNRDRRTWEPVDSSMARATAGKLSWLAGIDGESLVYGATGSEFVWINVLKE